MLYIYYIIHLITPWMKQSLICLVTRVSANLVFNWADSRTHSVSHPTPCLRINQNNPVKQFPPAKILTRSPIVLRNKDASPHTHWIFPN